MAPSIRSIRRVFALALLAWALGVAAQPKKKLDPTETKARELFSQGQKAYDVGQFQQALSLYSEAYKLKALPGFLFNIAQCHRQLGNYKDAAFAFGRFIDNSKPEDSNVQLARELIDDMQRRQTEKEDAERKAQEAREEAERHARAEAALKDAPVLPPVIVPETPPGPPVVVAEPERVTSKPWFWGLVGGGVVAVAVTGVVLALQPPAKSYGTPNLADINGR